MMRCANSGPANRYRTEKSQDGFLLRNDAVLLTAVIVLAVVVATEVLAAPKPEAVTPAVEIEEVEEV